LPEEQFVDRRMQMIEELEVESEDPDSEDLSQFLTRKENNSSHVQSSVGSGSSVARRYVGELIQRVEYGNNTFTANFIM
jgi:hypothetical protein